MATSEHNGNRHFFFLVIALAVFIFLFALIVELMLSDGVRNGKYKDPEIASKIVMGTVYDSEGSALAISVPSYDLYFIPEKMTDSFEACRTLSSYSNSTVYSLFKDLNDITTGSVLMLHNVPERLIPAIFEDLKQTNPGDSFYIQKSSRRSYPSTYHAGNLIIQTENALSSYLSPRPGFNENVTYGSSVHLTVNSEIQYILDIAIQTLIKNKDVSVLSFILDYETGAVLAMTSVPFNNPENSDLYSELAFCDSLTVDGKTIEPYFIESIDSLNEKPVRNYKMLGFSYSDGLIKEIMNGQGSFSLSRLPEKDNPKYLMLICSEDSISTSEYENAVYSVYNGLSAQGRF